jgi:N-acetylmuramoyl-L-alanine amidase
MQNNFNISIFVSNHIIMREIKKITFVFLLISGLTIQAMAQADEALPNNGSGIGIVVIDPGHGGRDLGAISGSALEKDIVLDIALKLGQYISKAYPDVEVIYTRKTDVFVPLHKRAELANKNNADLFISIHVNTVSQTYVQGTETYILGSHPANENIEVAQKENKVILLEENHRTAYRDFIPDSAATNNAYQNIQNQHCEQSALFAAAIQKQFRDRAKLTDRRVKQASFLVLRQISMPGVLIEAGFLSHPNERIYLMSEAGRDYLATSIYLAFKDFKNKTEEKTHRPQVAESTFDPKIGSTKNNAPIKLKYPPENDIWFSVQVAALLKQKEITPENFQNETTIFEQSSPKFHRYFCGKFNTIEKAREEKNRLQAKFSGAFVVAFENGKLISVKKALRKM